MKQFLQNKYVAIGWTLIRLWLGWKWITFGWQKITTGFDGSTYMGYFAQGANPAEGSATVTAWYGAFLNNIVLPASGVFNFLLMWGELFVGIALILGLFTSLGLYGSAFLNLNILLAGQVGSGGIGVVMYTTAIILLFAGPAVRMYGVDRWALPWLKTKFGKNKSRGKQPDKPELKDTA